MYCFIVVFLWLLFVSMNITLGPSRAPPAKEPHTCHILLSSDHAKALAAKWTRLKLIIYIENISTNWIAAKCVQLRRKISRFRNPLRAICFGWPTVFFVTTRLMAPQRLMSSPSAWSFECHHFEFDDNGQHNCFLRLYLQNALNPRS